MFDYSSPVAVSLDYVVFISPEFPLSLCPLTRLLRCVAFIEFSKSYSSYLKSPVSFLQDTTVTMGKNYRFFFYARKIIRILSKNHVP